MAIPATIEDFWSLFWRSGLVENNLLTAYGQKMQIDSQAPATPQELAQRLIRDGLLTHFQASQLLVGKWQGFTLGKYRLLERLGEGGMGAVYLAAHVHMRRRVALKILPPDRVNEASSVERFYREARAIAALDHPNIARAHDVDCDGKLHFLVMEFIDGCSLQDLVSKSGPLPIPRALDYLRQTALGLQHAHASGLIHRDIKPSNLVVNAQGVVKILDLGLARFFTDRADNLTKELDARTILGTADYIAPEQAMDSHNADIRADIYSLGCAGYHLLTGNPPFHDGTTAQKLIWHQMKNPRPLREVRPEVPEEVAAVIAKMMAKQIKERYQTPQEVAEALQPLAPAKPHPPAESEMPMLCPAARETSMVDPHKVVTSSDDPPPLSLKSLPTAARAADTMAPRRRAAEIQSERKDAAAPEKTSQRTVSSRFNQLAILGMACFAFAIMGVAAYALWYAMQGIKEASSKPAAQPPKPADKAPPKVEAPVKDAAEVRRFEGHSGHVNRLALSPDGRTLATVSDDKTVRLWDVATGQELQRMAGHANNIGWVAYSPDGKFVLSSSLDRTARLWDTATGQEVRQFVGHEDSVWGVAFAPDGRTCATASGDKTCRIWDIATGQELLRFTGHTGNAHALAFAPDGKHILSGGWDQVIHWWDAATGQDVLQLRGHASSTYTVAVSPDGRRGLTGGADHLVHYWDLTTGQEIRRFQGHTGDIWYVAFSPWGNYGVSGGSSDKTMRLWDLETGEEVYRFEGHTAEVSGAAISPDGQFAFSSSSDRTARMWEIRRDRLGIPVQEVRRFVLAGEPIVHTALSRDGRRVLAGGTKGSIAMWDTDTAGVVQRFAGHTGPVNHVAFAANGNRIASAGQDGTVRLWNAGTGQQLYCFEGHRQPVRCVVFAPSGDQVLSCGDDKTARLWEAASGQELRKFAGHAAAVKSAVFLPDGRKIITSSADHTLRIWDAQSGQELGQWTGHTQGVNCVALTPDGRLALSGGDDKSLHLWDVASGKSVHEFPGIIEPVTAVAVSGDGRFAFSTGSEKSVQMWDLGKRALVRAYSGHDAPVTSVALSNDLRFGVSGSADQTVRLWDLAGREGLVGYWPLDDGGGDLARDVSGGGHHGVLKGHPTWIAGKVGGALHFNGDGDAVDTGFTDQLDCWTASVWVKGDDAPGSNDRGSGPIHREDAFQFDWSHPTSYFRGTVASRIGNREHEKASFGPLAADTWYHLAATFDGQALKAYTNGVLVTTTAVVGRPAAESHSLKFGRHAVHNEFFRGTVDEVRLYNRALSEAEVQTLFAASRADK